MLNFPLRIRLEIRIGLNIGDVLQDRGEIFGDGVNLAARLEAAAEAWGYLHFRRCPRPDKGQDSTCGLSMVGQRSSRTSRNPVHVYRWRPGRTFLSMHERVCYRQRSPKSGRQSRSSLLPICRVTRSRSFLPTASARTSSPRLSKVRSFLVIARNSTFTYKGKAVDIKSVAKGAWCSLCAGRQRP